MLFGLTGLYCAGKNYVAALLERRGLETLDVDKLGHIAIEEQKEIIIQNFGNDILNEKGEIDRRILGEKVFGNPMRLAALEEIVHPAANRMTLDWIAAHNGKPCVINAALLHKSSALEKIDAVIFVRAPLPVRFSRSRKRDRLSYKEIIRRFGSQNFGVKFYRKITDIYVIDNGNYGFFLKKHDKKLNKQIDLILEQTGVVN